VQKRFGEDAKFILKAEKSVEEVRKWSVDIFHQKGTDDFKLPVGIWEWFLEVVSKAYEKAETDLVRRMILIKVIHTREVVRAGFDITIAEKEYEWNLWQVGTVCLLHDIARFDQALLGSFSDTVTDYDHALVGAKMINEHDLNDFEELKMNKMVVVEAVKHHSEYQYSGDDIYAKLTRDADKLALLRATPEIIEANIGGFVEEGVTEAALKSYREGEMVRHVNMKTRGDMFLSWLAWESDFNFAETKKLFINEGIKEWMLSEVKKRGIGI
jgi:hypothetical protein